MQVVHCGLLSFSRCAESEAYWQGDCATTEGQARPFPGQPVGKEGGVHGKDGHLPRPQHPHSPGEHICLSIT